MSSQSSIDFSFSKFKECMKLYNQDSASKIIAAKKVPIKKVSKNIMKKVAKKAVAPKKTAKKAIAPKKIAKKAVAHKKTAKKTVAPKKTVKNATTPKNLESK